MQILHLEPVKSDKLVTVSDCAVDNGYLQGAGGSLADVDCDFQADRRQEVKEYLERRYNVKGKQRVFSAGTQTTLKIKAAVKDVARVHRVPLNIVNYITAIFDDDKMTWTDLFKLAVTNKKVHKFIHDYPQVIEDIRPLMGQPRSASVHASAILITPDTKDGEKMECFDYTPIKKVDGILVSELDGYSLDEVGLLKNDCLGIKELSKIKSTIDECNRMYDTGLSFEEIVKGGLDDKKTYGLLSKGFSQNIFQFSSRGMTKFLMDMRPDHINDLIAAAALYRPATLESGSAEKYLDCKRGDVAPVYLWGTYEALKDTYGLIVYQEQVSLLVCTVGGFSLGDGVKLVKLISKKKTDQIHTMQERFMEGAKSNGCPNEDAEQIWNIIQLSGSYLFNKSHATAYAITAYVGAYLKANYATAFYTVALQWADDKEIPAIMSEMEQCSTAKIVPPDVNVSGIKFFTDYETDEIFWSLSRIKMLGGKSVEYIIAEREKNGPYASIENFIHRIFRYKLKKYQYWDDPDDEQEATRVPVNALHVRNLIMTGCFDRIENIKAVVERHSLLERAAKELGFKLSDTDFPADLTTKHYFWQMQQVALSGIGSVDYRRIYDNSDAKDKIRGKASYMSLRDALSPDNEGKRIAVCATVAELSEISYKDKTTGEKKKFCKIKLQQNNDLMELVIWNDFYAAHKSEINNLKDKMIITTCIVKYSEYTGANNLQNYKTSLLFNV
ncbi:DNA polymerase III subunit alpha [Parabacteroides goldsteinii]|uniref:helix-hairpin-helix domain-containing protein n=1 Tax=Parabacteroides goldsteinii TaxID=328812 RepID=UPI001D89F2FB|nr:DNA polymerase III subunit alpha [Parabacteroides goldsteinii]MBS6574775.1 DNA polymerase III subunit alpha [Parabacteroides goldsteinii]